MKAFGWKQIASKFLSRFRSRSYRTLVKTHGEFLQSITFDAFTRNFARGSAAVVVISLTNELGIGANRPWTYVCGYPGSFLKFIDAEEPEIVARDDRHIVVSLPPYVCMYVCTYVSADAAECRDAYAKTNEQKYFLSAGRHQTALEFARGGFRLLYTDARSRTVNEEDVFLFDAWLVNFKILLKNLLLVPLFFLLLFPLFALPSFLSPRVRVLATIANILSLCFPPLLESIRNNVFTPVTLTI